jgi:hypothetical protein
MSDEPHDCETTTEVISPSHITVAISISYCTICGSTKEINLDDIDDSVSVFKNGEVI